MATITTDPASEGRMFAPFPQGTVAARRVKYTFAAALTDTDVVQMIPVYEGERVVGLTLISEDIDTNGTPTVTLDVGDGVDPNRYIAGSTVGQAGGVDTLGTGISTEAAALLFDYAYTADDTIDITVDNQATAAAGSFTLIALVAHA